MDPTPEILREVTEVIMAAITELLAEVRGEPVPAAPYDHRKVLEEKRRKAAEEGLQ